MKRVLTDARAELLPLAGDKWGFAGTDGMSLRRRPASFTFLSETRPVSSWTDLLVQICLVMRERHPEDFERILEIRGRKLPYFSRSEEDVNLPNPIGESGFYASCQESGSLLEKRAGRVVEFFGYPADSIVVQTR